MRHVFAASTVGLATLVCGAGVAGAEPVSFNFDDVASLAGYEARGITFSANASIWTSNGPSVMVDPDGGARSVPSGLQFGNAGGVLGSVFFHCPVASASIWALSGPGPDNLNGGISMRAYDVNNVLVGEDFANATVQFDQLIVNGGAIARIDLFSPVENNDVWDDLVVDAIRPVWWMNTGDADNDGDIDLDDIGIWSANFTGSLTPVHSICSQVGDMDMDGDADLDDYGILTSNFTGSLAPSGVSVVPEPVVSCLAGMAAVCAGGRRRRRGR